MTATLAVHRYLCRWGPSRARAVQEGLRVSRSAFQRAVASQPGRLLVTGRARATTYAARRGIEGVHTPLPVFEVDRDGGVRHALTLHPVEPFGHYVEAHVDDVDSGYFETDPRDLGPSPSLDLPWFLYDQVPSGFLGRAWVRAHLDQGYPAELTRWTGDHALSWATRYGSEATGALVLGAFARDQRSRNEPPLVAADEQFRAYPALAERALAAAAWGSSPGGEQPKFTVRLSEGGATHPCIVKLSPPLDTPGGRRWADLLVAEHLCHVVLGDHGVEAAESSLVDGGGRRFLVVRRFDRHGASGRSGLISLHPFDRTGVASELRRWSLVTADLVAQRRLSVEDHERVRWLEVFGQLVANTDMHLGNLSLRLRGTTLRGLAPVYDMLPMFYAPRHGGELPTGPYRPPLEPHEVPGTAREVARALWRRVLEHQDVSDAFKQQVATPQLERVP